MKVRTTQTNLFNSVDLVDVGANTTTVETVGQTTRVSIRNSLADKVSEAGALRKKGGWLKSLTLNAKLSGIGGFNLNCDSGRVILSNPLNDYAGHTTLGVNWAGYYQNAATLQLGASEVIPHGEGKGNLIFDAFATAGAKLDLNGFDERVNGVIATVANAVVTNTAATRSTFTLSGTEAGCTYAGRFGGAMKIVKEGTNTMQTLTGVIAHTGATRYRYAPYKNSGEVCVKAGTLVVADSARFLTPGAVVAVEGGGTLRVESDNPFGGTSSTVMLYAVANTSAPTLNIPAGTTVTVRHFYLGGYFRKAGTYGAIGSGADFEMDNLFTGGGLLNVLGPDKGSGTLCRATECLALYCSWIFFKRVQALILAVLNRGVSKDRTRSRGFDCLNGHQNPGLYRFLGMLRLYGSVRRVPLKVFAI